jgi:hypothetical protein
MTHNKMHTIKKGTNILKEDTVFIFAVEGKVGNSTQCGEAVF